jgi:imidazolonepropionase-like amidohydrolase
VSGTVLPGFLDAHVHLSLIDPAALAAGGIARVVDLGGWTPDADGSPSPLLTVRHAGQFLAAPGGYPSAQSWAPAGSVCEVATAEDAAAAVDRQLAGGASVIKVTLNSHAGPVLASDVLAAIVARAGETGTPVVAHAEGVGQAVRAFIAGVDVLAHTPFSERLVDELVDAMAGRMTWISTLDIHGWGQENDDFARASDNLRRFHAYGGRVLYGTDLGNGPLPVGLNRREIDALLRIGMAPDEVLGSLTAAFPGAGPGSPTNGERTVSVVPGERPSDPAGFAEWVCSARALSRSELEEFV